MARVLASNLAVVLVCYFVTDYTFYCMTLHLHLFVVVWRISSLTVHCFSVARSRDVRKTKILFGFGF